jgi:predicted AlkP superfamily pyrophosphatase or phosphodiesterase
MIICDGMRADTAFEEMGYINSLCNTGNGKRYISIVDNPSVSKTNYETLHTGVPSTVHGITSNLVQGKSKMDRNIFTEMKKAGKTSACIGSSWFYDLYGKDPNYIYFKHKELNNNENENITYGRFFSDDVPSAVDKSCEGIAHCFQTADLIIYKYNPDYILIHLLTPDKIGHEIGIGKEYHNEISRIDAILGVAVPRWFDMGYDVIVTSDHGMDNNNNHGNSKCEVMKAPLYVLSKRGWLPFGTTNLFLPSAAHDIHHTDIAPAIINRINPNSDFNQYKNSIANDKGMDIDKTCL